MGASPRFAFVFARSLGRCGRIVIGHCANFPTQCAVVRSARAPLLTPQRSIRRLKGGMVPLSSPCFVDPERPNDYQRWLHEGLGRCGRGPGHRVGERAQRSVSVGANAVRSHGASRERGLDRVHCYRILGTSRAGFLSAACCRGQARGARAAAALSEHEPKEGSPEPQGPEVMEDSS